MPLEDLVDMLDLREEMGESPIGDIDVCGGLGRVLRAGDVDCGIVNLIECIWQVVAPVVELNKEACWK